jgi:hypothetical protein
MRATPFKIRIIKPVLLPITEATREAVAVAAARAQAEIYRAVLLRSAATALRAESAALPMSVD